MVKRLFTSESVTEGHPDKVTDPANGVAVDAIGAGRPGACFVETSGTETVAPERIEKPVRRRSQMPLGAKVGSRIRTRLTFDQHSLSAHISHP
jgi:S-adenosylmethionine synthetase